MAVFSDIILQKRLMEFTESNKLPGTLLFIDFEKAFDTLEWPFIQHTLNFSTLAQTFGNGSQYFIMMLRVELLTEDI